MSGLVGRRAVVVGGGIGGLSMAGALAQYFEQVEILERDRLTAFAGGLQALLRRPSAYRRAARRRLHPLTAASTSCLPH